MRKITLLTLALRNFKGARDFKLETRGGNVRVYGDNETGKTTLFDAFVWLLFDKDSTNRKDFNIKTLTAEGEPIHGLEHEVEGVFEIDGKKLVLRKVYSEKWTKKRGSVKAEFTGHSTDYYIDQVPVKKTEYEQTVSGIIDEEIFKLLTNPLYFNEVLKWQDRRGTLLQVCGDISDDEVIAANNTLSELPAILEGRSIEKQRAIIAEQRKKINDELEKIPVRIDEVQRGIPDISDLNQERLEKSIADLRAKAEEKEAELNRILSGGEISAKEKQLREIESEMLQIKNDLQASSFGNINTKRQELSVLQGAVTDLEYSIRNIDRRIHDNEESIRTKRLAADQLRQEWFEVSGQTFDFEHDDTCPTCHQALPEHQIEEARTKAEASFNLSKSKRLEEINARGKRLVAEADQLEAENTNLTEQKAEKQAKLEQKQVELQAVQQEIDSLQAGVTDVNEDPAYKSKQMEKKQIEQEILELRSSVQSAVSRVRGDLASIKTDIQLMESQLAKFDQVRRAEERIEELREEERRLAAEFEKLEHQLYLTEEFIRTKVNMLEEKINSRFKLARFQLFEEQINGGLKEVCNTTYKGVPYNDLNNAAKINIGLDIINTLSEHYGFSAPIFIDNAEAVTKFIDVDAQVISLIVSAADKSLRVEHERVMEEVI